MPPIRVRRVAAAMAGLLCLGAFASLIGSLVGRDALWWLAAESIPHRHLPHGALDDPSPGSPLTFLVVGSDSRQGVSQKLPALGDVDGGRADSIFLFSVHGGEAARVLALPRDIRVRVPGHGAVKLGGAREFGIEAVVSAARDVAGVPIHHVVEFDFDGFVEVVDAAGGLEVTMPMELRDTKAGLRLHSGTTRLDGSRALQLARARNIEERDVQGWTSTETGDIARIERQQALLMTLAVRLAGADKMTLVRVFRAASRGVWTDDSLGGEELRMLARAHRPTEGAGIEFCVMPTRRELSDEFAMSPFPPTHPGSAVFRVVDGVGGLQAIRWLGASGRQRNALASCPKEVRDG